MHQVSKIEKIIKSSYTIDAIIPVYNEDRTLENVIECLLIMPFFNNLIFINDGSTDNTQTILERYKDKITLLKNNTNKGKGVAVAKGIEHSNAELLVLLDADFIGYKEEEIAELVFPVLTQKFGFTVRKSKPQQFSGVRCYWHKDVKPISQMLQHSTRYGIEVILNKELQHLDYKIIYFNKSHHLTKIEKYGRLNSIKEYLFEGISIFTQIILLRISKKKFSNSQNSK